MPKKYQVLLKSMKRSLFWIAIIVIIILFIVFYDMGYQNPAIWVTLALIIVYSISYLPTYISRYRLIKFMKDYYMIEDDTIAENYGKSISKIREMLYDLSQKQKRKNWLIVFHEKHYIFYHGQTIDKFLDLYSQGYNEKQILKELQENDLRKRAEVKIIKDTLRKNNRLVSREISVKEREAEERFK